MVKFIAGTGKVINKDKGSEKSVGESVDSKNLTIDSLRRNQSIANFVGKSTDTDTCRVFLLAKLQTKRQNSYSKHVPIRGSGKFLNSCNVMGTSSRLIVVPTSWGTPARKKIVWFLHKNEVFGGFEYTEVKRNFAKEDDISNNVLLWYKNQSIATLLDDTVLITSSYTHEYE